MVSQPHKFWLISLLLALLCHKSFGWAWVIPEDKSQHIFSFSQSEFQQGSNKSESQSVSLFSDFNVKKNKSITFRASASRFKYFNGAEYEKELNSFQLETVELGVKSLLYRLITPNHDFVISHGMMFKTPGNYQESRYKRWFGPRQEEIEYRIGIGYSTSQTDYISTYGIPKDAFFMSAEFAYRSGLKNLSNAYSSIDDKIANQNQDSLYTDITLGYKMNTGIIMVQLFNFWQIMPNQYVSFCNQVCESRKIQSQNAITSFDFEKSSIHSAKISTVLNVGQGIDLQIGFLEEYAGKLSRNETLLSISLWGYVI